MILLTNQKIELKVMKMNNMFEEAEKKFGNGKYDDVVVMSKDKLKALLKLAKAFDAYDIDNDPGILVLKCKSKTVIWGRGLQPLTFARKVLCKAYDLSASSLRLTLFEQRGKSFEARFVCSDCKDESDNFEEYGARYDYLRACIKVWNRKTYDIYEVECED
jgi:hypothetical protein